MDISTSSNKYVQSKFSFWIPPFTEKGSSNFRGLDKPNSISVTTWGSQEGVWDIDVDWIDQAV